ncbi:MAG: DJ-1/PfpI family protein [Candidatus Melainabacteria bacterium]|nr:DJ-1/PfpI family protein [Candidatus Melainabacteria bacterium]
MTKTIEIVVFDGFDDMDVFGVLEALRIASFQVQLKSIRNQDFVTTASGVRIIPAGTISLEKAPDVLIIPGGQWLSTVAGASVEANRGDILELVRKFNKMKDTVIASVCTGSLILGRAGLLDNRPATTNQKFFDILSSMKAIATHARVVDDGDIVTAGGITASLDLGLWLVQRFCGAEKALEVSKELEFEMRGPICSR